MSPRPAVYQREQVELKRTSIRRRQTGEQARPGRGTRSDAHDSMNRRGAQRDGGSVARAGAGSLKKQGRAGKERRTTSGRPKNGDLRDADAGAGRDPFGGVVRSGPSRERAALRLCSGCGVWPGRTQLPVVQRWAAGRAAPATWGSRVPPHPHDRPHLRARQRASSALQHDRDPARQPACCACTRRSFRRAASRLAVSQLSLHGSSSR